MKTLKNQISYMDWRCRTVYFYLLGLDFLFFRTFCSRLMVFLVLRAFSALFLTFSFHLQCQKRENTKNCASFKTLFEFSFPKNQKKREKNVGLAPQRRQRTKKTQQKRRFGAPQTSKSRQRLPKPKE